MAVSRPFMSKDEETNRLISWILTNFTPKEETKRSFLREMSSNISGTKDGKQEKNEMRYRTYEDKYGKFIQPIISHNGISYPLISHKADNGTPRLIGDQTVWDDLRVPGLSLALGASAPDLISFLGAGNLMALAFDGGATSEQGFFQVQMPHNWKEGSVIYPHIHWSPVNANAGNVKWGLQYSWANVDATFPAVATVYATDAASGTAWDHQLAAFTSISGVGKRLSSMLVCRLFRDPADAADTYGSDAILLEVDFHYEIDGLGSDFKYNK